MSWEPLPGRVMAGHDQKVMAWGSFGTRRRACLQTSWTKPKEISSELAVFCCFFLPSASLHTDVIPLLWVGLSLGSSLHEGSHSALGTFQVQLSPCKDAKGRRWWVSLWGTDTCWKNWSTTLKESNGTISQQRHNLFSFVPFVVNSYCTCYLSGCLDTYPRKHLIKPLPLSFTPTRLTHIV